MVLCVCGEEEAFEFAAFFVRFRLIFVLVSVLKSIFFYMYTVEFHMNSFIHQKNSVHWILRILIIIRLLYCLLLYSSDSSCD